MAYRLFESRFELGRTVVTAGASQLRDDIIPCLHKHHCGVWGDLDSDDKAANEHALTADLRIVSKYDLVDAEGETHSIYIITEGDRSLTTIMLTCEY